MSNNEVAIRSLITPCTSLTGGLIHALHHIVDKFGTIQSAHIEIVADVFNISLADVRGVVSFYEDFKHAFENTPSTNTVRISEAEACQALGARVLKHDMESHIEHLDSKTSSEITLRPVYCLGLCALGPSAQVNGQLIARASASKIIGLLR